MSALDESRLEVERLRRAVTRKISRLRRNKGAELTGTQYDMRRAPRIHKRYTQKQLNVYADQMRAFLQRSTQYVGVAKGEPVPAKMMNQYRAVERKRIEAINKDFERYKNLPMPIGDETIGQRMEKMRPDHRHLMNRSVNSPYKVGERKASGIKGELGLQKLIKMMNERNKDDFKAKQIKAGRKQLNEMLEFFPGGADLIKMANSLTEEQFHTAWNFTDLPDSASIGYEVMMQQLNKEQRAFHDDVLRNETRGIQRTLNWASKLRFDG